MKFFKVRDYIKELPLTSNHYILMIDADRNIGKSYSMWEWMDEEFLTKEKKVMYIRNSKNAIDRWKEEFNDFWRGKYIATTNNIYSVKTKLIKDKDEEDVISYIKDDIVGYICYMSSALASKSLAFENVEIIFYEEYNEMISPMSGGGIFITFINLLKSVERFKDNLKVILMGNRDSANNEFKVNFGIEPPLNDDDDEMQEFLEGEGFSINIGSKSFQHLGNADTLANKLATFNRQTNAYLNESKFIQDRTLNVINYIKKVKDTFKPIVTLINKDDEFYVLGEFIYNGEKKYCAVNKEDWMETKYSIPLNKLARLDKSAKIVNQFENGNIMMRLFKIIKQDKMFYCSFDIKYYLTQYVAMVNLENF